MSDRPNISDDGKWRWTGTEWVPNVAGPAAPPLPPTIAAPRRGNRVGWILACGVCLVVGTICGAAIGGSSARNQATSGATPAEAPTVTVTVTAPAPTPTPAPSPITLSGQGSKVTDPVQLASGPYRVSWTAQGHDNFIVHARQGSAVEPLINEIPPSPSSGEVVFDSPGGAVFFEVEASTLTWSIKLTKL
jgi:hypothetical protein